MMIIDIAMGIVSLLKPVVMDFFPDDEEKRRRFEAAMIKTLRKSDLAEKEIAKIQAQHKSVFVAGWRPFIGWICGAAMVYHFLIFPLLSPFVMSVTGVEMAMLEWEELSIILMSLLGFGAMRSYEKFKKVARNN